VDIGHIDFSAVDALLSEAVQSGVFPGASVSIRNSTQRLHEFSVGQAEIRPRMRDVTRDTVWDLASLTKVLATTPIAMAMVAAGDLDLDAPIQRALPDAPKGLTAAHLLTHTSGLPAWQPMQEAVSKDEAQTEIARQKIFKVAMQAVPVGSPGSTYVYSDLGFMTLAALLETIGGDRLDALFERYVRAPSGVDLRWGWAEAAATEDCPYRERVVVGEVHDLNAWLMGGVSAHAGLFGSVGAVADAAAWQLRAYRGETREGLSPSVVQRFFSAQAVGSHHLGWDGVSEGGSAGPMWPKNGVGHLAFTGCSLWLAPRQDIVVAFCSNRVHPEIEGGAVPDAPIHPRYAAFRALRPVLHSVIVEALGASSHWPL